MRSTVIILSLATVALFITTPFAQAKKSKPSITFTPGTYSLVEGKMETCGDGEFHWRDGKSNIALGVFHGFQTKAATEAMPSDIPEEKGCVYDATDLVDVFDSHTVLTNKEVLRCGSAVKHIAIRTATLYATSVTLTVDQTGENEYKYSCKWNLKKKK